MCSQLLEDIVRITVDRRKGRNAIDTGNFELIYKQVLPPTGKSTFSFFAFFLVGGFCKKTSAFMKKTLNFYFYWYIPNG